MDGSVLASIGIGCETERALRPARRKLCSVAAPSIDVHRVRGCNEIGAVGADARSQFSERAFDVSSDVVMLRVDKPRRDSGDRMLEFRAPLQRHCTRPQPKAEMDQNAKQKERRHIEQKPILAGRCPRGQLSCHDQGANGLLLAVSRHGE